MGGLIGGVKLSHIWWWLVAAPLLCHENVQHMFVSVTQRKSEIVACAHVCTICCCRVVSVKAKLQCLSLHCDTEQ